MTVQEMLETADLLDYVSQYTEFQEKNGEFWACSPLQKENTPSFHINADRKVFYDFSSGRSGNIVSFIQAHDGCSLREAIEKLEQYLGGTGSAPSTERLGACRIAKQFADRSRQTVAVSQNLGDRYMDNFEFDTEKLRPWINEGISVDSLKKYQVRYDRVQNRIVYPIRNLNGEIINVSGRTLDPQFKEKRIRKYTYYRKLGALDTVYGLAENREAVLRAQEIILFEGAKSVMKADSMGFSNTGAILTSHLNRLQMKALMELGVRTVFALDKDVDILQDVNIRTLKHYVPVEYVFDGGGLLEDKMSPVDAGKLAWENLYNGRRRLK